VSHYAQALLTRRYVVRVHRGPPRRGRSWVRQTISLRAPGGHSRVTHSRNQADPRGHRRTRRRSNSSTGGTARTPQDARGHGIAPVRDREAPGSNPGPPTKNRIQIEVFACSVWHAGVTGRSQIFLELGGGSPVQVDFEPSIELAHGYPTADISARARLQDREAPGFENQRRCPRRCAAGAQVRTVRQSRPLPQSTETRHWALI